MSMLGSGSALGDFRLAGMYDGCVCGVAMGGGASVAEETLQTILRRVIL